MRIAPFFDADVRLATVQNTGRLNQLRSEVLSLLPSLNRAPVFLARPKGWESGRAIKPCGVIFLSEHLVTSAPDKLLLTLAIHECIHLRVGCDLITELNERHPDVSRVFHESVLPAWIKSGTEIVSDEAYISHKGWRFLYPGWWGPTSVTRSDAASAVASYFDGVKAGCAYIEDGHLDVTPIPTDNPRNVSSLEELYAGNPDETRFTLTTGYELVQYLNECIEATLEQELNRDVGTLEEAFANYVACGMTGVSFDDLQAWAPQDTVKITLAQRLEAKSPFTTEVLKNVETHRELVSFFEATGIT